LSNYEFSSNPAPTINHTSKKEKKKRKKKIRRNTTRCGFDLVPSCVFLVIMSSVEEPILHARCHLTLFTTVTDQENISI